MDFSRTKKQQILFDAYKELGNDLREGIPADSFYKSGWEQVTDAGLWKTAIPEQYGGDGGTWWDYAAGLEGLAQGARNTGFLLSSIAQITLLRALIEFGTEKQKQRYIPDLVNGELASIAIADPDSGTDLRGVKTRLTPLKDGNFALNGGKFNIVHAPDARYFLVVAKLEDTLGKDNVVLVVLETGTPGFEQGKPEEKLGNKNCPTSWLAFDDCIISQEDILGLPAQGAKNLISCTSIGRLFYTLIAVNVLEPALGEAMDFAANRNSFRKKLEDHQYVQKRITDIKIGIVRSRWLAYAALSQLLSDHEEAFMSCSIAKVVGAEDLISSAEHLLRLYGSRGYQSGSIASLVADSLGFVAIGGTDEMHRKNIFNQMQRVKVTSPKTAHNQNRVSKLA